MWLNSAQYCTTTTACLLALLVGVTGDMQRRFMWRGMSPQYGGGGGGGGGGSMMHGLVDGMMSGARAMFGDLLPASMQAPSTTSPLDYLPTETTRIKYIIRDPHTNKPVKIIKMRPPKKVVKLMTMPHGSGRHEQKPNGGTDGGKKQVTPRYPHANMLRQMEKEKEEQVVVDGQGDKGHGTTHQDDIYSGKIFEFGGGWRPVASALQQEPAHPDAAALLKAYPMSELHTSIVGVPLAQNELHEHDESASEATDDALDGDDMLQPSSNGVDGTGAGNGPHQYEVTEYTAEESVALPLTQDYRQLRGFLPSSRAPVQFHNAQTPHRPSSSSTTTTATITTTTEEAPNYPAAFLKHYRATNPLARPSKGGGFRASASMVGSSWLPSNNTSSAAPPFYTHAVTRPHKAPKGTPPPPHFIPTTLPPPVLHVAATAMRVKSQRWPGGGTVMPPPRPFVAALATQRAPHQHILEPAMQEARLTERRKGARLKESGGGVGGGAQQQHQAMSGPRDLRQRGSVKFGDKINWE